MVQEGEYMISFTPVAVFHMYSGLQWECNNTSNLLAKRSLNKSSLAFKKAMSEMFTFLVLQNVFRSKIIITICLKSLKMWKYWTNIAKAYSGWWYIEHILSNVAGHLWEMTDLKYPERNVLHILSGKVPKQHCSKKVGWQNCSMLPCLSSASRFMSYCFLVYY